MLGVGEAVGVIDGAGIEVFDAPLPPGKVPGAWFPPLAIVIDGVGVAVGVTGVGVELGVARPIKGEFRLHSLIAKLRRAASSESTVSEYFLFTIIQDSKYWQVFTFGSQLARSLSPFDLFNPRETATNARLSVKSFAKASR